MSFKDQLAADAANCFLNTNEFAENIVYIPSFGWERTIKAVVNRRRLDPAGEDSGRVLLNQVEIFIANDSTNGLATIQKGVDKFSFPEVLGGENVEWIVADILSQDEGLWQLLLTK